MRVGILTERAALLFRHGLKSFCQRGDARIEGKGFAGLVGVLRKNHLSLQSKVMRLRVDLR